MNGAADNSWQQCYWMVGIDTRMVSCTSAAVWCSHVKYSISRHESHIACKRMCRPLCCSATHRASRHHGGTEASDSTRESEGNPLAVAGDRVEEINKTPRARRGQVASACLRSNSFLASCHHLLIHSLVHARIHLSASHSLGITLRLSTDNCRPGEAVEARARAQGRLRMHDRSRGRARCV